MPAAGYRHIDQIKPMIFFREGELPWHHFLSHCQTSADIVSQYKINVDIQFVQNHQAKHITWTYWTYRIISTILIDKQSQLFGENDGCGCGSHYGPLSLVFKSTFLTGKCNTNYSNDTDVPVTFIKHAERMKVCVIGKRNRPNLLLGYMLLLNRFEYIFAIGM